jgi:hypothetical protein
MKAAELSSQAKVPRAAPSDDGNVTLRQAALTAGFAMLIQTVAVPAEFFIFPKLIVPHDMVQTGANIVANRGLYFAGAYYYLINFITDVVIAWAFYILFVPVNRALSLLAAWFSLVYIAVALVAWMNLLTVFRLLTHPDFLKLFGTDQLHAQMRLLLFSWRAEWATSLIVFACHLLVLGYLIYRSGYVPKFIGVLYVIDGIATAIDKLQPYLFPSANLDFLTPVFFFEWVLMIWLLIFGWRLKEPVVVAPG